MRKLVALICALASALALAAEVPGVLNSGGTSYVPGAGPAVSQNPFLTKGGVCNGKFPNLINDICWSCMFPVKMFGKAIYSGGQKDYDSQVATTLGFCSCSIKPGYYVSFWEMALMADVTHIPGCFPLLGGVHVPMALKPHSYGYTGRRGDRMFHGRNRRAFRHVNLYINPAMVLMGALLDSQCLDGRAFDIPYTSALDPTQTSDKLSLLLMPYAPAFSSKPAVTGCSVQAPAAFLDFPIPALFWCAPEVLPPYSGSMATHKSPESTARVLVTRTLAKLHAAGTVWGSTGVAGMCGYYPMLVMDLRMYKYQRLLPRPQTEKYLGQCCDTVGTDPIFREHYTKLPIPGKRDFSYAIFRKRDCCSFSPSLANTWNGGNANP